MRSRHVPVVLLAALVAALGCERAPQGGAAAERRGAATPSADVVVATVDGVPITRGDLERRVRVATDGDEASAADASLHAGILEQLVEERVLLAEASRRGLTVPDADVDAAMRALEVAMGRGAYEKQIGREGKEAFRTRVAEGLLIRALFTTVPAPRPITEHDVRTYYQEHRAEFAQPEQFRARVLTVATRAEAEALRAQLADGADFAALAAAKSTSPEKDRGGDLGFVPEGQLPPELDKALAPLGPGELSPVVESPYGFHVLKLEERRKARQRSLDDARDQIRETLRRTRVEAAHERWLADLMSKAKVEVLDPALRPPAAGGAAEPAPSPAR